VTESAEDLVDEVTHGIPKLAPVEELIVPAPSNPVAVAKMFLEHHYPDDVVGSLLRHHRNTFHRYDGSSWPELDERRLESDLYLWLAGAKYWKKTKDDVELVDFEPTRYKIADLIDAIRAVTHLDAHITTPAWITGEDQGQVVPLSNGLLTIATRKLIPHTPAYFSPHVLPFEYDPTAPRPARWFQFIDELWRTTRSPSAPSPRSWATSSPGIRPFRRS
jgi:putative DNA primase/helicase